VVPNLSSRAPTTARQKKDNKYNIHSVTIVRNGSLVLDSYLYPFKYGKKHAMHSATKSVTSALIGIAIDKGLIKDVHQLITQLFPDKKIGGGPV